MKAKNDRDSSSRKHMCKFGKGFIAINITKWIDLGPEWKFLVIIGTIMVVLSIPFLILDLMETL